MNIPTPAKPREVVCFKYLEIETEQDGLVYFFLADDMYSHFMMMLEPSQRLDQAIIMKKVDELMHHKDFSRHEGVPFILIVDFGEELLEELNLIIEPHQGQVVFDPEYIEENMGPDLEAMFQKPEMQ